MLHVFEGKKKGTLLRLRMSVEQIWCQMCVQCVEIRKPHD